MQNIYADEYYEYGAKLYFQINNNKEITWWLYIGTKAMPNFIYANMAYIFDSKTYDKITFTLTNVSRNISTTAAVINEYAYIPSQVNCLENAIIQISEAEVKELYRILTNAKSVGLRISGREYQEFILSSSQVKAMIDTIEYYNNEFMLLVTGENPAKAGVPYIARALDLAKPYFSNLKIEVMPLKTEEYAELIKHGMNGVICFQETYNKAHYNIYHPRGMKSKFEWRVNGFDRMGQAGVHSIGMGVLIGLEKEWRTDITMMAYHLRYLQKHYWKTKYSVNFPRMRPSENGGFQPNVIMSDRELAQVTFAMRIFDHDVDISYSTREPANIRDHMAFRH